MHASIVLPTQAHSETLAESLAENLSAPAIFTFSGDIGSGKTTLIRALLRQLGIKSSIKSPTFSLVETYDCADFVVHHFDFYRIENSSALDELGLRDYLSTDAVCFIEWPKDLLANRVSVDVAFSLTTHGDGRELCAQAYTTLGRRLASLML